MGPGEIEQSPNYHGVIKDTTCRLFASVTLLQTVLAAWAFRKDTEVICLFARIRGEATMAIETGRRAMA